MNASFWIHFVTFVFFFRLCTEGVSASCSIIPPSPVAIRETDNPGHVAYSQTGSVTTRWDYTVEKPVAIAAELQHYFRLENNATAVTFIINKTVDLEEIYELWNVQLQVITLRLQCYESGIASGGNIEFFVTVDAVNEFDPVFVNAPFTIDLPEDQQVNTAVFTLRDHAYDRDVNPGQSEISIFSILKYSTPQIDGRSHFNMIHVQNGIIVAFKPLDYESMSPTHKYYQLNVSVQDYGGRMTTTTMKINILDVDDQGPEFFVPGCQKDCLTSYKTLVNETFTGPIENVLPSEIKARDRDTSINNNITYTMRGTDPSGYGDYFSQDPVTGVVNVSQALNDTNKSLTEIVLFLEATEVSVQGRSSVTTFQINIDRFFSTTKGTTMATEATTAAERVQSAGSDTLMIVLIVLAIVAFILAATFIVAVIIFKKKYGRNRLVGPDETPSGSEKETDVEDLSTGGQDGQEQWPAGQFNGMPTTGRGNELPPLKDMSTGTEEQKKVRRSRRRKKEKDTEEFDGTQTYEDSADVQFYGQRKTRIKQSSRSKQQLDPKYWITVDNDYE